MGAMSIWHWLIVLVVVLIVFGTKKLRGAGGDLGSAVKNFKDAMKEGEDTVKKPEAVAGQQQNVANETRKENV